MTSQTKPRTLRRRLITCAVVIGALVGGWLVTARYRAASRDPLAELEARYGPPAFLAHSVTRSAEFDGLEFRGVAPADQLIGNRSIVFIDSDYARAIWRSFVQDDLPMGVKTRPAWFFPRIEFVIVEHRQGDEHPTVSVYPGIAYMNLDVQASE